MGRDFSGVMLAAAGGALAMLVLVGLVALVRRRGRSRADLVEQLEAAQRESDDLRQRLDAATARLETAPAAAAAAAPVRRKPRREAPEYLITDAGLASSLLEGGVDPADQVAVPDRLVLSATVGAPLVKAAAFTHGVRRAMSAESRNRIWFEMRREVRASRKRRRRLLKDYQRAVRAEDRAKEGLA